ncbi:SH3 domain-containing protein [Pontitalea aquivivens]|uniref:hypothetical protein n=1 Tax=Pontitalea aquivivens TaxID=3388663 RepID=UPI003970EB9A
MAGPVKKWAMIPALACLPLIAHAEIDGHGPDAWRVSGVTPGDTLNARMGPGIGYKVVGSFAHDERGLIEVTCVPLLTMDIAAKLTEAEVAALPSRWCLMRAADLSRAGWVAARFLIPDNASPVQDADPVAVARDLVRALYAAADQAGRGGPHPLDPDQAADYFFSDIATGLATNPPGADPLTGAQDFDGQIADPVPDPEQPMMRGMITIHVGITNFGRSHTAVFRLRPDPSQPGAPIRIFRIEQDGWQFPN